MKNQNTLLKITAVAAILTLIVAIGIYMNMPRSASAAINWGKYDPEILAMLGLPKTVANPGTTLTTAQQRVFNAQLSAINWATGRGAYMGLTPEQSMDKFFCTFYKSGAATAPKSTRGNYFVWFGGQHRLWVSPYSPIPNSEVAHMVSVWEEARGIDVPNTPLTGIPAC